MDTLQWERLKHLLAEAEERPEKERGPFLRREAGDDPVLLAEALSLCDINEDEMALIEQGGITLVPEPDTRIGENIGPWRIERELGRGGMGTVYLARRTDDEFHQVVAIKVIKRGMDTDETIERFRKERQILANLNHPYIAQLHEGGTTSDGLPFLVMEYVTGEPITSYCANREMSVRDCLALFLKVCSAVQFAHRNLVVHRDIKPANVLVTAEGEPRLLDFGIAKIVRSDNWEATHTVAERRLMTPECAAPEQILGQTVTTACDVYALGVLLFELLTGNRPYTFGERSYEEIRKVICEHVPRPASQSLEDEGARQKRRRTLQGDLDTIVAYALRKEPERRYASVSHFAEDINRYLRGYPVQARGETATYILSRFVRRNRLWVGGAAVLFILTAAFATSTWFQQRRTEAARQHALEERDKAQLISGFLKDLFRVSDPYERKSERISARALLDRSAHQIKAKQDLSPLIRAELLQTMGDVYTNMGAYQNAEDLLADALQLRMDHLGENSPGVVETQISMGEVLNGKGLFKEAETHFRAAMAQLRPDMQQSYTRATIALAASLRAQARYEDTIVLLEQLGEQVPGDASPRMRGLIFSELATTREEMGDTGQVEPLLQEALRLLTAELGADHPEIADVRSHLAKHVFKQGDFERASLLFEQVLQAREKVLGRLHPAIADVRNNLSITYRYLGRLEEAEYQCREALALYREVFGPDHYLVANASNTLADLLSRSGFYAAAEPLYQEANTSANAALGEDHPMVVKIRANLGVLYLKLDRPESAYELLSAAVELQARRMGADHPSLSATRYDLAEALDDLGKRAEAEAQLRLALRADELAFGEDNPKLDNSLTRLAQVLLAWARFEEAGALFHRRERILGEAFDGPHLKHATALGDLGTYHQALGRMERAESFFRAAITEAEAVLGKDHARLTYHLQALARYLEAMARYDEAESLYERAVRIKEQHHGPMHRSVAVTRNNLARFYHRRGRLEEAEKAFIQAITIKQEVMKGHPSMARSLYNLALVFMDGADPERARKPLLEAYAIRKHAYGAGHSELEEIERLLKQLDNP